MVKYSEKMYIDVTEVNVGNWMDYYKWLFENKSENEALKVLPDSNEVTKFVWEYINREIKNIKFPEGSGKQKFVTHVTGNCDEILNKDNFYQKYKGKYGIYGCPYKIEPITGLSYEQVVGYCKWKTLVKGNNQITYRLPTSEEWMQFALQGLSEYNKSPRAMDSICAKSDDCHVFNFKYTFKDLTDNGSSIVAVAQYSPSYIGVYDLFGNVSEMTLTKGEAKGGNYNIFAIQCHIDSIQPYTKPEKWLGFRCVAVEK